MSSPFNIAEWKWDRAGDVQTSGEVTITRWRRGPVTFYRLVTKYKTLRSSGKLTTTTYALCPWDNVMLYFTLPQFGL